jgi:hypothetical protein
MANPVSMYGAFKGIPSPEDLGMGMNSRRAGGLLLKVAKSAHKSTLSKPGALRGGNAARGTGKSTGGKK